MRLTVLGKSPSWQDADGACSGYLIEEDGTSILLDCGKFLWACCLCAFGAPSKTTRGLEAIVSATPSQRTATLVINVDS